VTGEKLYRDAVTTVIGKRRKRKRSKEKLSENWDAY